MSTIKTSFAVAIMLAIWNFASTEVPILIDVIEPQTGQVHFLRLERDSRGFLMLAQRENQWIQSGEIGHAASQPSVYHFGGRGVSKPLDLAAALPDFADITDVERADVSFRLDLDGDVAELRQIRSGAVVTLIEPSTSTIFILHAGD